MTFRLQPFAFGLFPSRLIGARGSRSLDPAWSYSSVREGEKHEPRRWNQVSFRATTGFAPGPATSGR